MAEREGRLLAEALHVRLGVVAGQSRQIGEAQRFQGPSQSVPIVRTIGFGGQLICLAFGGSQIHMDIVQPKRFCSQQNEGENVMKPVLFFWGGGWWSLTGLPNPIGSNAAWVLCWTIFIFFFWGHESRLFMEILCYCVFRS